MTQLPETAPFMHELFCQRRFGFRFMDSMEDVFRRRQRVEHESEAVDSKFEIFTGTHDEINRARQILSPTFLVWLESHSPEAFAFELVAGCLVANVKGHKKSAARARPALRSLGRGRGAPARGGDRAARLLALTAACAYSSSPASSSVSVSSPTTSKSRFSWTSTWLPSSSDTSTS